MVDKTTSGIVSNLIIANNDEIIVRVSYFGYEDYHVFYLSTDNGATWDRMDELNSAFGEYSRISLTDDFIPESNTIVLCSSGGAGDGWDGGQCLKYNLNANTLNSHYYPGDAWQWAKPVDFINDTLGFIAVIDWDYNGYLCRTINGGSDWDTVLTSSEIKSISFVDENTGFVNTDNACWKTVSQGDSWEKVFETSNIIRKVSMSNSNIGVLGGDKIWLTIDGGSNWNVIYEKPVKSIETNSFGTIYAITNDGKFFYSENLGESWSSKCKKGEGFYSLTVSGDNVFAAIGNNYDKVLSDKSKTQELQISRLKN